MILEFKSVQILTNFLDYFCDDTTASLHDSTMHDKDME